VLDHHDRIRAARNHAAGRDQHCLATPDNGSRDDASVYLFLAKAD
jgi:hypothetical protein